MSWAAGFQVVSGPGKLGLASSSALSPGPINTRERPSAVNPSLPSTCHSVGPNQMDATKNVGTEGETILQSDPSCCDTQ